MTRRTPVACQSKRPGQLSPTSPGRDACQRTLAREDDPSRRTCAGLCCCASHQVVGEGRVRRFRAHAQRRCLAPAWRYGTGGARSPATASKVMMPTAAPATAAPPCAPKVTPAGCWRRRWISSRLPRVSARMDGATPRSPGARRFAASAGQVPPVQVAVWLFQRCRARRTDRGSAYPSSRARRDALGGPSWKAC
jgi:hypothetical protein